MDELAQRRLHRQDSSADQPLWREVLGARLRRLRNMATQVVATGALMYCIVS